MTSRCSRLLPVFGPADGILRPEELEKGPRTIRAVQRRWFRAFFRRERGGRNLPRARWSRGKGRRGQELAQPGGAQESRTRAGGTEPAALATARPDRPRLPKLLG